jgi:hypothetical protein
MQMKWISCLFGLFLFPPLQSSAEADGPDYWSVHGVSPDSALNFRTDPDLYAHKVGAIPPDATCLKNLGCQGGLSMEEFTTLSAVERRALQKQPPAGVKLIFRTEPDGLPGAICRKPPAPITVLRTIRHTRQNRHLMKTYT